MDGHAPKQAPQTMHFSSSTINERLLLTIVGRIAATGQRATAFGSSQSVESFAWSMRGGRVCLTIIATSACPPQLMEQQDVESLTLFGISRVLNSA